MAIVYLQGCLGCHVSLRGDSSKCLKSGDSLDQLAEAVTVVPVTCHWRLRPNVGRVGTLLALTWVSTDRTPHVV